MPRQKFPRYYNATAFDLTADTQTTAGQFIEILRYQVPAQQEIAWGIGAISGGVDFRKYIQLKVYNTSSAVMTGLFRVAIANANKTDIRIVMEDRSENTGNGTGVQLAETSQRAKEDSWLLVYFNPDATEKVDTTDVNNIILLPTTVYQ